jgi:hypothetical protein
METYSKGSYQKEYRSDDYYNTNSMISLQRVNDSAEDTSGASSQRIETAKGQQSSPAHENDSQINFNYKISMSVH